MIFGDYIVSLWSWAADDSSGVGLRYFGMYSYMVSWVCHGCVMGRGSERIEKGSKWAGKCYIEAREGFTMVDFGGPAARSRQ